MHCLFFIYWIKAVRQRLIQCEKRGLRVYQQEKKKIYRKWLLVFGLGFFLGILIMNFGCNRFLEEGELLDVATLSRIRYMEIDGGNFLKYELPKRFQLFLMLLFFSTTCFGIALVYFCIAWQGILTGMIMTAVIIKYGIKGLLLLLAGIFPQHFLFIPAAVMMLCWCCQTCSTLYFPGKNIWLPYRDKGKQYLHQAGMLLWIFFIVVIGCIMECYVNPILVSDIVKLF